MFVLIALVLSPILTVLGSQTAGRDRLVIFLLTIMLLYMIVAIVGIHVWRNPQALTEGGTECAPPPLAPVSESGAMAALPPQPNEEAASERLPTLFISTPVRGFEEDEYQDFVMKICGMIRVLRTRNLFGRIFYESEHMPTKESFEKHRFSTTEYFRMIEDSDVFVAVIPLESVSSVYFGAGYAVGRGKRSIYFVPDSNGSVIPNLMKHATFLRGVHVTVEPYDSYEHILDSLLSEFALDDHR
jgi:hypothetical protein